MFRRRRSSRTGLGDPGSRTEVDDGGVDAAAIGNTVRRARDFFAARYAREL